jgi:hypothetical protein
MGSGYHCYSATNPCTFLQRGIRSIRQPLGFVPQKSFFLNGMQLNAIFKVLQK